MLNDGLNTKISNIKLGRIVDEIVQEKSKSINIKIEITRKEYESRWKKVQSSMASKGYDLLYACGSELDRSDIAWLAGIFDPMIERYGLILPLEGRPIILAGWEGAQVFSEAVERSGAEIAQLKEFQISDQDYRWANFISFEKILHQLGLSGQNKKIVIVSSPETLPYSHFLMIQRCFKMENIIFDPGVLSHTKYEKSDAELAIMQEANKIADAALRGMLAACVPGVTELQVASVGDMIMKALGARRTGFCTIVTSGNRGYTIIGAATNKVIRKGETVSLGVSPTFNGYHGVVRRTIVVGKKPSIDQIEFFKAVEGLYVAVIEAVQQAAKENLPSNYIDAKGKEYLEKLKLKTLRGSLHTPHEPYIFVHNIGCSECQEGFGAVTPYTNYPLGNQVALAIDTALIGFEKKDTPIFPVLYAVIEDAFWKKGTRVGVYNIMPLNVQHLVGNLDPITDVNPYHKEL
jgi:Xaa-Pro aminopeptidase